MNRIIAFIRKYSTIIKVLITGLLLWFVLSKLDWSTFQKIVPEIQFKWIVFLIMVLFLNVVLGSLKWRQFLVFAGINLPFSSVYKITGLSLFYNQILPGRIGGDFIKLMFFSKREKNKLFNYSAAISIFIDRFSNIIGLLLVSIGSFIFSFQYHKEFISYLIIFSSGSMVVFVIVFWGPSFVNKVIPPSWEKIRSIFKKLEESRNYINTFRKVVFLILSSITVQLVSILAAYCAGNALNIDLPFEYYLFFIPIVFIITLIPITIGGFGIREVSFVFFLNRMSVPEEKAILLSIIMFLGVILVSFPFVFFKNNLKILGKSE